MNKESLTLRVNEINQVIERQQSAINQMMADLNMYLGMRAECQRILSELEREEHLKVLNDEAQTHMVDV